jgi:hypothetical protein
MGERVWRSTHGSAAPVTRRGLHGKLSRVTVPLTPTGESEDTTGSRSLDEEVSGATAAAPGAGALGAVVLGMAVGAVFRRGAFYPLDAFGVAVVSVPVAAIALRRNWDRRGQAVTLAMGALAGWWFVRALMESSPAGFLPFGASVLGFLAAYLSVRSLGDRERSWAAEAIVAVGAVASAVGLLGVSLQLHALAQRTGGVWRMSTNLTYPAGAAVLFIVALLVAVSLDLRRPLPRAALCLCVAGLVAAQSRWELLALACGALLVPARRWVEAAWPLALGSLAGVVVVASTDRSRPSLLECAVVLGLVVVSTVTRRAPSWRVPSWFAPLAVIAVAGFIAVMIVHPLVGPRAPQPADQGQTLAWSSSGSAWRSSIVTGVGPPRIDTVHDAVDTYPGFVPDGYLTVGADGGLLGALLLTASIAAVASSIRRRDLATSCAAGAALAFAVAGAVDFNWQLPALALVGGAAAGLAAERGSQLRFHRPTPVAGQLPEKPRQRSRGMAVAGVVLLVAVAMGAQLLVGADQHAGGASSLQRSAPPAPSTDPEAPARMILAGPWDDTDPFMFVHQGRYYLYTSEGTTLMNVPLRIGSRPGHWGTAVDVLPRLPAWATGGLTWAPDVHAVSGGWALYFTALLKGVNPPTHCIGSAFASSPSGPFTPTDRPFICQLDHRGSIDARVLVTGGHLVMLWKSEDNANPSVPGPDQNGRTGIYAQNLSADGRTLLGRPVKIFAPSEPWEGSIVEAPDMVEAWDTYWLFFSGNWYYSTSYGIGVAACQTPFGPCSDPYPVPFLGTNRQGAGPGEESLFEQGRDVYLLYNPFRADDPGPVIPRPVAMVRLGFRAGGPYLATP